MGLWTSFWLVFVFLVKLDGVCLEKNQEVCLEKERRKTMSLLFCWQLALDLSNEAKKRKEAKASVEDEVPDGELATWVCHGLMIYKCSFL